MKNLDNLFIFNIFFNIFMGTQFYMVKNYKLITIKLSIKVVFPKKKLYCITNILQYHISMVHGACGSPNRMHVRNLQNFAAACYEMLNVLLQFSSNLEPIISQWHNRKRNKKNK